MLGRAATGLQGDSPSGLEECHHPILRISKIFQLALPHRENRPTEIAKCLLVLYITLGISAYLRDPILAIGLGQPGLSSARMAMPKASMHEDYLSPPREHQIRRSWEVTTVESVAVP